MAIRADVMVILLCGMKTVVSIGVIVVLAAAVTLGILFWPKKPTIITNPVVSPLPISEPTPIPIATTSAEIVKFTVTASNFSFDLKQLKVKKGDTVILTFKNSEGFHDFKIDEFDVATNQIGEGEEEEVEFVADKVGTFEYYCSVGKHRAMGMVGKLIVE
ncbi:MAG: plastocyanin/azurin family copper-binding protein [Patescibacteria group bacterium]